MTDGPRLDGPRTNGPRTDKPKPGRAGAQGAGPGRRGDRGGGTAALTRYIQERLDRLRALDRRRPVFWDLTLTGFWTMFAVLDYTSGGWRTVADNRDAPEALVLLMSLCFSVPLLWRRSRPLAVLVLMAPVSALNIWTGAVVQAAFLQLIPAYTIALTLPLRTFARSALLMCLPAAAGAVLVPGTADRQLVSYLWGIAFVALLGIAVRTRRDYTEALVERAHRLERERDQQARLAAAAERARIAREMHDIIGHNLSVITGLADGGSYAAAARPERAAQALEAIGTTSRQAMAELRRVLGVLRETEPAAELAPQPSLTDLDTLLAGVRDAGLAVRLTVHGRPPKTAAPPGCQLAVYRVVQESLTNTLKHAGPGATADVTLTYTPGALEVLTTDTGGDRHRTDHVLAAPAPARPVPAGRAPQDRPPVPAAGRGRGISGMRERASLYNGTLEAGPLPTGGWRTLLRLPLEDSPA
ncbi:sensor histidine kinase [Streptomyces nitrosporeus]|uniref:sensor histidine kinase n=1 Tax=Streptomyces nitrosporeus TaxID=28894 RepID=UPI00399FF63A